MKLLIFGATGSVGRHLLAQALGQGHDVTAFVRDPSRVDAEGAGAGAGTGTLNLVRGDVLDAAAVAAAMPGHEAVLSVLGAGRDGSLRSRGTGHIVEAMRRHGPRRLICLSSLGVGDSRAALNWFWKYLMFGLLLRAAYADHGRQEAIVRDSGLDWTLVRPGAFTDDPAGGDYRHGSAAGGMPDGAPPLALKIGRADLAGFMLRQLHDGRYLQRAASLSY